MTQQSEQAPFGHYAPTGLAEKFRQFGHELDPDRKQKLLTSILLRLAGGKKDRPFDVELFDSQKARLYPKGNICEKRVFIAPQYWEADERRYLAHHIEASPYSDYYFVDAGANVGLYSLFVNSILHKLGKAGHFVAIEPEKMVRERLAFNMKQSGLKADILPYALSDKTEKVKLVMDDTNMGSTQIGALQDGDEADEIEAKPLLEMMRAVNLPRIDALKMDIEGYEQPVLTHFFAHCPTDLLPRLILVEEIHQASDGSLQKLCEQAGYHLINRTKMNLLMAR
ncbi:MAG: FkbM family methyltransferase [bacterium]